MTARGWIPLFDGFHRRVHEAFEDTKNLFVEHGVFERDSRLGRHRLEQALTAFIKRYDLLREVLRTQQPGGRILLLVDELQHADDVRALVDQRNTQHRRRAVADLLVERAIHRVRRAWRQVVDVRDVDGLALHRRRTRDGLHAHRDGELAPVELDRIVLGELEPEYPTAHVRVRPLHDIDGAGVGVRDEARLLEDESEELVRFLLRAHHARDLYELPQLIAIAIEPLASALGPRPCGHHLERIADCHVKHLLRRFGVEQGSEPLVDHSIQIWFLHATEQDEHRIAGDEPGHVRA